ncbi:inositol monophosphatase [uncultured Actinobacillus sp.]|uniref:inositol monophosphatase family protein n=1 Tax=uncultured Actinobacillus sp. TaxID=417616 RepID=UPI0025FE41B6|nr:inositol monophosphatase [uncultured Actinobacillus sp.]
MNKNIQQRYLVARNIIQQAGKEALSFYLNRNNLEIIYKKGEKQDLVSIADKTVESIIKSAVQQHFPDDGFLGEESGAQDVTKDFCWVVDPIDGTSPFLYGLNAWCISIAVLYRGDIVIGLIYDPQHDELFHCTKGNGAYLNQTAIQCANAHSLTDGLMGLGVSHRVSPQTFTPFLDYVLKNGGMFIRNGSGALMCAYVAAGRLIGYYEPHINSWDCLAGILLVEEAGGKANAFLENNGLLKGNPILVSAAGIFAELDELKNSVL